MNAKLWRGDADTGDRPRGRAGGRRGRGQETCEVGHKARGRGTRGRGTPGRPGSGASFSGHLLFSTSPPSPSSPGPKEGLSQGDTTKTGPRPRVPACCCASPTISKLFFELLKGNIYA